MALITPTFVDSADTVAMGDASTDPRWTGIGFADIYQEAAARTAAVIAMPAPGYAICWGSALGTFGFLEVEFDAEHYYNAEILQLKWTSVMDRDVDWTPADNHIGGSDFFYVFPDDGVIVATAWGEAGGRKLYHRRFTYGTTFGSLAADTGLGILSWASGTTVRFQHEVLDPDTILWVSHRNQSSGGGFPQRWILWYGTATPGTSSTHTSGTSIEPTTAFPALSGTGDGLQTAGVHWVDSTTGLIVASYTDNNVETDIATALWSGGLGAWTKQNVGAGPVDMPGWETIGRTVPGRRYRSDQDTTDPMDISGSWIVAGTEFEADTGETLFGLATYGPFARDGANFQTLPSGMVEAAVPTTGTDDHRTWDPTTGENVEAWSFGFGFPRRAQEAHPVSSAPAWIGITTGTFATLILYMVFEDEPAGSWIVGRIGWPGRTSAWPR